CHKQRDHEVHGILLLFQFGIGVFLIRVLSYSYRFKKIYSSAKHFMKNLLASIRNCSRLWGSGLTRAIINTPAMLGNSSRIFACFSSRVLPGTNGRNRSRYAPNNVSILFRTAIGLRASSGPMAARTQPVPGEFK